MKSKEDELLDSSSTQRLVLLLDNDMEEFVHHLFVEDEDELLYDVEDCREGQNPPRC